MIIKAGDKVILIDPEKELDWMKEETPGFTPLDVDFFLRNEMTISAIFDTEGEGECDYFEDEDFTFFIEEDVHSQIEWERKNIKSVNGIQVI